MKIDAGDFHGVGYPGRIGFDPLHVYLARIFLAIGSKNGHDIHGEENLDWQFFGCERKSPAFARY